MTRPRKIINSIAAILIIAGCVRLYGRRRAMPKEEILLEQKVAPVKIDGLTFDKAVEQLASAAGWKVRIEPSAAKYLGTEPVSTELNAGSFGADLDCLFSDKVGLDFYVKGHEIVVCDSTEVPQTLRIYDIRDIFQWMVDGVPPDDDPIARLNINRGWGPSPPSPLPTRRQAIEDEQNALLVDLIHSAIAPRSWQEAAGNGTLKCSSGWLIVQQTPAIHRRLELLLSALREAPRAKWIVPVESGM